MNYLNCAQVLRLCYMPSHLSSIHVYCYLFIWYWDIFSRPTGLIGLLYHFVCKFGQPQSGRSGVSSLMSSQQKQAAICHLLLHFWVVSEDYYRAVTNSSFKATTIIAPATKATTNGRTYEKAAPTMGKVFSAVAERVNAIEANKKPRVSSAVTLRRPTITPRIASTQIAHAG